MDVEAALKDDSHGQNVESTLNKIIQVNTAHDKTNQGNTRQKNARLRKITQDNASGKFNELKNNGSQSAPNVGDVDDQPKPSVSAAIETHNTKQRQG